VTVIGATLGAIGGGLIGGAAVWALGLPPCVQGGYSCGGLENAWATAIGILVAGYFGAVIGGATALRVRRHPDVGATAGTVAVLLLVGIAAWWGALWLGPIGFVVPLLLPAVAALSRWTVIRLGGDVRPAIEAATASILAGLTALLFAAALSGRHCPFHPPPECSAGDLWFYAASVGPVLYLSPVLAARLRKETDAKRIAVSVAMLLAVGGAAVAVISVLTHLVVGLFLLPFATSATIVVARRRVWRGVIPAGEVAAGRSSGARS
jgi:hypothetical protein